MVKSFKSISLVRSARLDQGLSCSRLAIMCGMRPSLIIEFEQGKRPICRETYNKILAALGRLDIATVSENLPLREGFFYTVMSWR